MPDDKRLYRTREFARLAGVTPRALHHYDRLGLLTPKRSSTGYRCYSERDFERLAQIVALKFIGVPLKKIQFFTTRTQEALANALRAQRQTLEAKRQLLDRAIAAVTEAEAAVAGQNADAQMFRRIIEVINMQNKSADWNKKYEGLVQAKIERLKSLPQNELEELRKGWAGLCKDIEQSLGEDPAGTKGQELATRWVSLLGRLMGGPIDTSMIGSTEAYQNYGDWSGKEQVLDFIRKALAARP